MIQVTRSVARFMPPSKRGDKSQGRTMPVDRSSTIADIPFHGIVLILDEKKMLSSEAEIALKTGVSLMETLRGMIADDVSMKVVHAFLLVCLNEGKGTIELADMAGVSKSTMSRHLLDLSENLRSGDSGYDLLSRTQDPNNMRSVRYILTPKGKMLRNNIASLLS